MDLRDSLEGVPLRRPWADVIHFRVLDVGECVIERVRRAACVCHVIIVFTVAPPRPRPLLEGVIWWGRGRARSHAVEKKREMNLFKSSISM